MPKDDQQWMQQALQLAELGRYTVSPNPCVGCVLVKNQQQLGAGYHQQAGCAHAEINALQGLSVEQTKGATLYVTLEPCCHQGRTPPCTQALINAKLARVVIAQQDANPLVAGQGVAELRAAGMQVEVGLLNDSAAELNRGFMQRFATGLPRVRAKLAASLDGRTALANGESKWLTGGAARQDVQYLRAESCAIISSARSVLADQARLTVRPDTWPTAYPLTQIELADQQGHVRQPLRVVLDRQQSLPTDHPIFAQPGRTVWCVAQPARSVPERVDVLVVPQSNQQLDLRFILQALVARQCYDVLLEAGPRLVSSFVAQNLVDELWVYVAPLVLGDQAQPMVYAQLDSLQKARHWQLQQVTRIADDARLIWRRPRV